MPRNVPRVYVQPLGAYNEAKAGGAWVEVDSDPETFQDDIQDVLEASSVPNEEEWAYHDYENFGGISIGEYESVETLSKLVELLEDKDAGAVAGALDHVGGLQYLDEAEDVLENQYAGEYSSLEDWAWDFLEDSGQLSEVPESLKNYIDVEKWARDAELGGDVFSHEDQSGQVHVFWSR
jgi:antirestriction protein